MTNLPLVLLLASLPLIGGCAGGPAADDTGVGGDADTDVDADTDADTDPVGATFEIALPVAGATVAVDTEVVPCDDTNVCTYTGADDDTYTITAWLEGMEFARKYVTVTGGVPDTDVVSWNPGGCPDTTWAGYGWCLDENGDDAWVMGEYAMAVEGEYCEQGDPEDCYDVETHADDLDGDGADEVVLYLGGATVCNYNVSGNLAYGFNGDGEPYGYGSVESDLSVLYIYSGGEDGDAYDDILVRQDEL